MDVDHVYDAQALIWCIDKFNRDSINQYVSKINCVYDYEQEKLFYISTVSVRDHFLIDALGHNFVRRKYKDSYLEGINYFIRLENLPWSKDAVHYRLWKGALKLALLFGKRPKFILKNLRKYYCRLNVHGVNLVCNSLHFLFQKRQRYPYREKHILNNIHYSEPERDHLIPYEDYCKNLTKFKPTDFVNYSPNYDLWNPEKMAKIAKGFKRT